jgi:hypothetical protein
MKNIIKNILARIGKLIFSKEILSIFDDLYKKMYIRFDTIESRLNGIEYSLDHLPYFSLTEAARQEADRRYQDMMLLFDKLIHFVPKESLQVQTDYPVAYESNDHKVPWGTKNDNTRSPRFVVACERLFPGEVLRYMDLGCSGGGLVLDFLLRGHQAVGLEGSDYSQKSRRAEWRLLDKHNLFTADITQPFQVKQADGMPFIAHVISAWEVIEHIAEDDLPVFFENVKKHLQTSGGYFIGSIASLDDVVNGISYHHTVKSKI